MKKMLFILMTIAVLGSCSSDTKNNTNDNTSSIEALETRLNESKSVAAADSVVAAYTQYISEHPDDVDQNAEYLYRAGSTMFQMKKFSAAIEYLKRALKDFYPAKNNPAAAELLAVIYGEKMQSKSVATTAQQAMATAYPDYKNVSIKEALPADLPDMTTRMGELAQNMFDDKTGRMDYRLANEMIQNCELYALILPKDEQSPVLLHKAAETARSIRAFPKALEIYEWVYTKFPNYKKAPQALFLHAFTLDNDLQKYDEAKKLYEEFLQKYPEDEFADDTQALLNNLGKSPEEMIKSFQKK